MLTNLTVFFASYVGIFLRAFQQKNVQHNHYPLVLPTSIAMGACEVVTVGAIAVNGWSWIVLWIGVGAGLGSMTAMYVHTKFVRRNNGTD